ncbi:MAG: gliding motility-associated C-terminal domain-containing protein [Bacteroidia bacterium]|nr:gliding motility-associated C-terminal domain-containing protein [Bacteroidia bacterium]MDW8159631.1 gliding motility-associated C-terminal domain-containing protein [Bacteroidia bacterium]
MHKLCIVIIYFYLSWLAIAPIKIKASPKSVDSLLISHSFSNLFEENKGQWPQNILFKTLLQEGGDLFFEKNKLIFRFEVLENTNHSLPHCLEHNHDITIKGHTYFLTFLNANPQPSLSKKFPIATYKNYFIGNNPQKWASYVRNYQEIIYHNLYPNIDLKFYNDNHQLKYDFIIAPYANYQNILLQYTGIEKLQLDEQGNLIISTSIHQTYELAPKAYQIIEGVKKNISCQFVLLEGNKVKFEITENYDPSYSLIIDPQLIFSTFSGARSPLTINLGYTSTFGSDSSLFTGSIADNNGIPTTPGAYQRNFRNGYDIVIYKFNPLGTQTIWVTYIGGNSSSRNEFPLSLITDNEDNLLILGVTDDNTYPIINRKIQAGIAGNLDFCISKLSKDGSALLASTFFGGPGTDGIADINSPLALFYIDHSRGEINLDKEGNIIIFGSSNSTSLPQSRPTFSNNNRGLFDAVLVKLSSNLDSLHWAAFLGGSNNEAGYGVRVNSNNEIIVVGGTTSNNFPTTPNAWQPTYQGGNADGFVAVVSRDGQRILYSTFVGTNNFDQVLVLDLDKEDNIYVAGQTRGNFPIFPPGIYNNPNSGQFVVKFPPNLAAPYFASRFGSGNGDIDITLSAMLVDICENIYLSGWGGFRSTATNKFEGSTRNMPYTEDPYNVRTDKSNYYLIAFSPNMQQLSFATFIGNSNIDEHQHGGTNRFDKNGIIYQSSCLCLVDRTNTTNLFPTTPNAFSRNWQQGVQCLTGAFKFDFDLLVRSEAKFKIADACDKIEFINLSKGAKEFKWYFGNGDSSLEKSPGIYHFKQPGTYTVTLVAKNIDKCNITDTARFTITIPPIIRPGFIAPDSICGLQLTIVDTSANANNVTWSMGDGTILRNPGRIFTYTYAQGGDYTITQYLDTASYCGTFLSKSVHLQPPPQVNFDFQLLDSCGGIRLLPFIQNASQEVWQVYNGQFFETFDPFNYRFTQKGEKFIKLKVKGIGVCNYQDSIIKKIIIPQNKARAELIVPEKICGNHLIIVDKSQGGKLYHYQIGNNIKLWGKKDSLSLTLVPYGKHFIRLTIDEGDVCGDTLEKETIIFPLPQFIIEREPQACALEQKFYLKNLSEADTWKWTFSNGKTSTELNPIITFTQGKHFVKIIATNSNNGCLTQKTDTFNISSNAKAFFEANSSCERKVPLLSQSIEAFSYRWIVGEPVLASYIQKDTFHIFEKAGKYSIIHIINENTPCADTFSKIIEIWELPKAQFEIIEPPCTLATLLKAQVDNQIQKVYWWINEKLQPQQNEHLEVELEEGAYRIKNLVVNKLGCKDSMVKEFHFSKQNRAWFEIPNIFTPNNDGINDFFEINTSNPRVLECVENIQIYDRWGNLVFQANTPPFRWDGNFQGQAVKNGTYFYIILFQHNGQKNYRSGMVTVLR